MNLYIQVREKTDRGVVAKYIMANVLRSRATLDEMIYHGGQYFKVLRDTKQPGLPRYIEIDTPTHS